jgi:protein SCO1/2
MALCAAPAAAITPRDLAAVDFSVPSGATLPLAASFLDEQGKRITLGEYLEARPAVVVLGYYGCSSLCSLVLQGVASALASADLRAGRDLDVVVISIAPQDSPADAQKKKRSVLAGDAARDAAGWHFLTGDARAIAAVTQAAGYASVYDAETRQYAHAAGALVVGAGGRVQALLPGIVFPPAALRASLVEPPPASFVATRWLRCFHYDPQTGRYSVVVMNAVRLAALAILAGLAIFMLGGRRGTRRQRAGSARGQP